MSLPGSGALSLSQIQTEFGGSNPVSLTEYYAGGANVPSGTGDIPTSGAISVTEFYGTSDIITVAWSITGGGGGGGAGFVAGGLPTNCSGGNGGGAGGLATGTQGGFSKGDTISFVIGGGGAGGTGNGGGGSNGTGSSFTSGISRSVSGGTGNSGPQGSSQSSSNSGVQLNGSGGSGASSGGSGGSGGGGGGASVTVGYPATISTSNGAAGSGGIVVLQGQSYGSSGNHTVT